LRSPQETPEGIRLQAPSSLKTGAPTVIVMHGWLGHADSGYVLSAAAQLWEQGFPVVRLNLSDHSDAAHLNEEMFHSARIEKVIDAVSAIRTRRATP
jgi:predicted alpha/beta-fold hydrolase